MMHPAGLRGARVIAAMSGGVDSSLVAALLQQQGAEVIGVFLQVWDYQRTEVARHGSCCALEDAYDARRVCDRLGIPFYSMDMRHAFRQQVIDPFIADYAAGRTPNPCARCNRFVKFGALLRAADELGVEWIATGHYVQRVDDACGTRLLRAIDRTKDQSYFLATTEPAAIQRLCFPLGRMHKEEVRARAARMGLPTAAKRESQDICFIPDGDRTAFLRAQRMEEGFRPG
ncbi:MAG: tRNA 2-thiouridine(34) synthase MnmA, partial [Zetaproteobacteria bacterium]